jgi:hypothetical protein
MSIDLDLSIEVEPQFFVELALDACASEERTHATNQVSPHGGSG